MLRRDGLGISRQARVQIVVVHVPEREVARHLEEGGLAAG